MTRATSGLDESLLELLQQLSRIGEHPAQLALREVTAPMSQARMQISVEQGRFMQWIVRTLRARRCLEVGTFTGYSALTVALMLPADGRLIACDVSREWTSVGLPYWQQAGVAERIDLRLGPAADTLRTLIDDGQAGSFDFAFVDADKAAYPEYAELCLELLRPGGVLALDNAFLGGRVAAPPADDRAAQVMRPLLERLFESADLDTSLVPISDGLLVATKRIG